MACLLWLPIDGVLRTPSQKALIDQIPATLPIDLLNYLPAYRPILFHSYLLDGAYFPEEYRKIV
jgi:hypothetical protein